jgi:hypothetical protein
MKTCLGTLIMSPNDDKRNNFLGSNAFGKLNSIYNPTGFIKFIIRHANLVRNYLLYFIISHLWFDVLNMYMWVKY